MYQTFLHFLFLLIFETVHLVVLLLIQIVLTFISNSLFHHRQTHILKGEQLENYGRVYLPPAPEFQLTDYKVPCGMSQKLARSLYVYSSPVHILLFYASTLVINNYLLNLLYVMLFTQPDHSAPTIILVLDGEGFLQVHDKDVLFPLHVGSVSYLNPQTAFTVTCRNDSKHTLHLARVGVNESAAFNPSTTACAIA